VVFVRLQERLRGQLAQGLTLLARMAPAAAESFKAGLATATHVNQSQAPVDEQPARAPGDWSSNVLLGLKLQLPLN
jgi:hypothetical protein